MKTRKLKPGEEIHRWIAFGKRNETLDTIVWCVHCKRKYRLGDMRVIELNKRNNLFGIDTDQMCAYDGCSGDTVIDAFVRSD